MEVTGSKTERYVAPEPAGSTSYWNKRVLDRPMISLEDGVLLRPKVEARPPDTIALASGRKIRSGTLQPERPIQRRSLVRQDRHVGRHGSAHQGRLRRPLRAIVTTP